MSKYTCPVCGEKFRTKAELELHLIGHRLRGEIKEPTELGWEWERLRREWERKLARKWYYEVYLKKYLKKKMSVCLLPFIFLFLMALRKIA